MTTFQAIVYAIIHGASQFLPISTQAHHLLIPYLLGWQPPTGALLGAFSLGSFLALLIYFRHDWASMISCLLQVILFRKKPMTLDERLPLFLGISTLPVVMASSYFHHHFQFSQWSPVFTAMVVALGSFPVLLVDSMGRKNKGMFDWNGWDAITIGVIQATAMFPGWDHLTGILVAALFLNYGREPALKYAYFALTPLIFGQTLSLLKGIKFSAPAPMPDLSWLSFIMAIVVSFTASMLVIGGFLKQIQQNGVKQYMVYRWVLALLICGVYWFRNRSM